MSGHEGAPANPQPGSSSRFPSTSEEQQFWNDPISLLQIYPFVNHMPTARVSEHLAPHTVTYPPSINPAEAYPQYAANFSRLDNPQDAQDWEMRNAVELRARELLQSAQLRSGSQPYPSQPHAVPAPPPATFVGRPHPPLPYNLIPQYGASTSMREPPTPTSMCDSAPSPSPSQSAIDYFEAFVDETLARAQTPAPTAESVTTETTPSIARTLARTAIAPSESPDPLSLGLPGPSPTKKQKHENGTASPTIKPSSSFSGGAGKQLIDLRSPPSGKNPMAHYRPPFKPPSFTLPKRVTRSQSPDKQPVKQASRVEVVIPSPGRSSVSKDEEESDDELDWGDIQDTDGDWKMGGEERSPSPVPALLRGSGRTGDRDARTTFQKLQTLFEDIFEESDNFSAEPTLEELMAAQYFSSIRKDGGQPLLSNSTVEKITRYVSRLRGGKKVEGLEWDREILGKGLRLMERSMLAAEGLVIFKDDRTSAGDGGQGSKKAKGKKGKNTAEGSAGGDGAPVEVDNDALSKMEQELAILSNAGQAAACTFIVLDSPGIHKQILSEDGLALAVQTLRDLASNVIFPVMEGLAGNKINSSLLARIIEGEQAIGKGKGKAINTAFAHPTLSSIASAVTAAIPHLTNLITRSNISFSDTLVIPAVYLSIAPFFVEDPGQKKKGKEAPLARSVMKTLRVESLECLRGIFAKYDDQRQWIIEEILASMARLSDQGSSQNRFQIINGKSIHTVTALLLQLVQASAFGAIARVRKLRSSVAEAAILGVEKQKVDLFVEEARICNETIDSALKAARFVAGYLVQRSGVTRANKTTSDSDYKAALEIFSSDLMSVLYRPEWPAASMFISILSRLMISALEETKTSNEANAARSLALDHLGSIGARLKSLQSSDATKPLPSLDEVISAGDNDGLSRLLSAHSAVHAYLSGASLNDAMFGCANDLSSAIWGQELSAASEKVSSIVEKLKGERDEEAASSRERLQMIGAQLTRAAEDIWKSEDGLFSITDPKQQETALQQALSISRTRSLQAAFHPILHALSAAMNSPVVALRSKALRALSSVVTVDPDILSLDFVREALEERLSDSSPLVRDAAVELVGKYIVQKPALATDYYPHLAMRVDDTGLAVRKRVIKLLRGIFATTIEQPVKIDICVKMIDMISDRDDTVSELATKALAEILYSSDQNSDAATLFVDVLGEFSGPDRRLEHAVKEISSSVGTRFRGTIDTLISRLVDATEQTDFDALSHIKAIYLLCNDDPTSIDISKANILLSYLRPPTTTEEQAIGVAVLQIFQRCIPKMPRAASTFAQDLTKTLSPMISKPKSFPAVKEMVGCYCLATVHLVKDYKPLLQILRACEGRLRAAKAQYAQTVPEPAATTATAFMMYITALIVQHCDLDEIAEGNEVVKQELLVITDQRLSQYFFDLYLGLSKYSIVHNAPSISLGCLFHSYPSLILRDEATEWMNKIFAGRDYDSQARLFGVMHDFLASEAERKASGRVNKDIAALIGNNSELSESGVSTAVVQRNIKHILHGVQSTHFPTQSAALDVLAFTVTQGLYHPLQCLPVLIALETSEEPMVAERALALHTTIHSKHASLVNVRYLDFAKASYSYQRDLSSEVSGHRHGEALLTGWYSLLSEKKAWRSEFLKALSRVFDYDLSSKQSIDVGFVLYIAENLATLDYKLQDEVMTVIQYLNATVSEATVLAEVCEKYTVEGANNDTLKGKTATAATGEDLSAEVIVNSSIVVCLALLTKNHLLDAFSLAEDKCLKHVPGKKSAYGDKPAVKKGLVGLELGRVPLVRGVETVGEYRAQIATTLQLLHEEGSLVDVAGSGM